MTESGEIIDPLYESCEVEFFDPPIASWEEEWEKIREDVLAIEKAQFKNPSSEEMFSQRFQEPGTAVVLLRDKKTDKIVGYRYSIPLINYAAGNGENFRSDIEREDDGKKTAYILNTAIHPDYIGHRLSSKLINKLDDLLRQRNYRFVELDPTEKRHYADKVVEHNKDRIVAGPIPHPSSRGPEVFLRRRL